jgi:hypothetical protein
LTSFPRRQRLVGLTPDDWRETVRPKLLPIVLGVAVLGAVSFSGMASAGTAAVTTLTIKAQSGDLSGTIDSPRPMKCARNRNVIVYKQKGKNQDVSEDRKVASDTAGLNGDRYEWSIGNSGLSGKFYAHVKRTPDCKAASSRTVKTQN